MTYKLSKEEKNRIIEYRMENRRKHKRCSYCKYKQIVDTITYLMEDTVDYTFYCPWKEKYMSTAWSLGFQGCFCKHYEPEELTLNDV